jgi:hypothetical protein
VSHLGDAASLYWPGKTGWYGTFARWGVGPSEPDPAGAAEHALDSCPSRPLSTESEEARRRATTDPAQVKMYATGPNRKGWDEHGA